MVFRGIVGSIGLFLALTVLAPSVSGEVRYVIAGEEPQTKKAAKADDAAAPLTNFEIVAPKAKKTEAKTPETRTLEAKTESSPAAPEAAVGAGNDETAYREEAALNLLVRILLIAVSCIPGVFAAWVLFQELRTKLPNYTEDEMVVKRYQAGAGVPTPEAAAEQVYALWNDVTAGEEQDEETGLIYFTERAKFKEVQRRVSEAAALLPVDDTSLQILNTLANSANLGTSRLLIAPGIHSETTLATKIILSIAFVIMLALNIGNPFVPLVLALPLVCRTPLYLVGEHESSKIYAVFAWAFSAVFRMSGNALVGFGNGEGSTATVYRSSSGRRYVEEDHSTGCMLLAIRLAVAFVFLSILCFLAPLVALFAFFRNYVLYR